MRSPRTYVSKYDLFSLKLINYKKNWLGKSLNSNTKELLILLNFKILRVCFETWNNDLSLYMCFSQTHYDRDAQGKDSEWVLWYSKSTVSCWNSSTYNLSRRGWRGPKQSKTPIKINVDGIGTIYVLQSYL